MNRGTSFCVVAIVLVACAAHSLLPANVKAEAKPQSALLDEPATAATTPTAPPAGEEVPAASPRIPLDQRRPRSREASSGQSVTVRETDQGIILANGILAATITKSATISSLKYKSFEMATAIYYSMDGKPNYRQPGGGHYFVKTNTPDIIDVGFMNLRKNEPQALDCEIHYVLQRGSSGIYSYAILSHPADYPKTGVGEWRMVWKLSNDLLENIYVDDLRHWQMPSSEDFKHAEKTGIKEIVKLTTGVRAGQFDCKYDYSASYYDIGCWGHASDKHKVGGWIVLGGYDYFNDGPTKQDLNAASGINHIHFGMDHYDGSVTKVEAGEEWRKIYGPFLLYCNHSEKGGDTMWADAKRQVEIEKAAWPYAWLTDNPAYPPAKARGTLAGHLVLKDALKPKLCAANAWVGLAQPPAGGNWQFESNHYQYWAKADAAGDFTIPHVRPGTYTFYSFTNGAVGEYSRENVVIKVGANKLPRDVVWEVPRKGRSIAWEIGVPDRTAKEFRHGTDYFHGYVWTHFHEEFKNPLDYTVGKSDWSKDWNFAQSWYQVGEKRVPWRWCIHFDLTTVPHGDATMTIAIAAATEGARINVYVNDDGKVFSTVTPSVRGGNAMLRESIHSKYCVEYLTIPTSRLKQGANTIALEQVKTDAKSHVMYDYLNLELP
jgi:rhamnogalacturonan endolyase